VKVLVVGGAREHALSWACTATPRRGCRPPRKFRTALSHQPPSRRPRVDELVRAVLQTTSTPIIVRRRRSPPPLRRLRGRVSRSVRVRRRALESRSVRQGMMRVPPSPPARVPRSPSSMPPHHIATHRRATRREGPARARKASLVGGLARRSGRCGERDARRHALGERATRSPSRSSSWARSSRAGADRWRRLRHSAAGPDHSGLGGRYGTEPGCMGAYCPVALRRRMLTRVRHGRVRAGAARDGAPGAPSKGALSPA